MVVRDLPIAPLRRLARFCALVALPLWLCACVSAGPGAPGPAAPAKPQAEAIGTGKVKAGLILPLGAGGNAGAAAASLRNAAELAVSEFSGNEVQLIVKDDRGTADGARQAAQDVLAEGAEVIIGPLLAPAVQSAGQVAKAAGKPVIAFSTDSSVASRGVYLLSFMPESDVDRIVEFAASKGKRSIAGLVPETSYGTVTAAALQESAAKRGVRVVVIERYKPGDKASADAAAKRIAGLGDQADALFLPENGDGLATVGPALAGAGVSKLQLLGTGQWDDPRALKNPAIQGGWFAAPDKAGFNAFATRYRAKYGADPSRIAPLAYDAVFLVSALAQKYGAQAFNDATLANADGVVGTDGLFRFRADGVTERGLAVLQVKDGSAVTVAPAPRTFPGGA